MTTQLDCSIGISAAEGVFGTAETVDQFLEFTDESLEWDPTFVQGQGMRVGSRLPRSARRVLGKQQVKGDLTVEAASSGLGRLLQAAFGTASSTQTAADSGVYQQVHTPATSDNLNSHTLQKGIPRLGGGTVDAFTFPGAMCDQLELSVGNSELLKVKTSWVAREVLTDTVYAAPSYPAALELFSFVGGAIAIGGTVTKPTTTAIASGGTPVAEISDFDLTWANNLDDGGYNLGGAGKRSRKQVMGMAALTGKLTAEYDNDDLAQAYLDQADLCLLLTFTGLTKLADDTSYPVLQIYVPELRLEGEVPKAAGGKPITQSIGFTGLDGLASSTAPIYAVYVTPDTAI